MSADNLDHRGGTSVGDQRCGKGGLVLLATGDQITLTVEREAQLVKSAMAALRGDDPGAKQVANLQQTTATS